MKKMRKKNRIDREKYILIAILENCSRRVLDALADKSSLPEPGLFCGSHLPISLIDFHRCSLPHIFIWQRSITSIRPAVEISMGSE